MSDKSVFLRGNGVEVELDAAAFSTLTKVILQALIKADQIPPAERLELIRTASGMLIIENPADPEYLVLREQIPESLPPMRKL